MKKITCFILTLLIIVGVSPFAFATHIKVYDKNFERMIPELRSTLKWEKNKEKSTEWMGKDHRVHWRDGGYEQEYYDEFYSDQLDYLLSYPFEEYVESKKQYPNLKFDEDLYDGINYKDPSGQRMFLFIQLNSDRMYDDFVVTLKDCGMTGNMGFYIEFYPQYFGGPGAEDDGYWGNPGGYYGGPPAQHNIHGGNGSYIVSISDLIQAIKEAWKKITGEELGDAQVAMIICDLFFECGSGDGYDLHAVGDSGHAFGLCQWNDCFAHRTIDMINYCEENYPDIPWQDNLEGQVEFMVLEMIPGNQYSDSIWIEYGYNEFMNLDEDHIGRGVFLLASYFERCAEENRSGRQWAGDNAQGTGYLKDVKDVNQELAQQSNNNNNNNNNNNKPNSNINKPNKNDNNNNSNSSNNKPNSSQTSSNVKGNDIGDGAQYLYDNFRHQMKYALTTEQDTYASDCVGYPMQSLKLAGYERLGSMLCYSDQDARDPQGRWHLGASFLAGYCADGSGANVTDQFGNDRTAYFDVVGTDQSQWQRGDIVNSLFYDSNGQPTQHVSVYLGDGWLAHIGSSVTEDGCNVKISHVDYMSVTDAIRPKGDVEQILADLGVEPI